MKLLMVTAKEIGRLFAIRPCVSFESKSRVCAVTLFCFCVACDFWLTRASPINSDMVQNYNELAAIWAGNLRLHGWDLATNNYYLTDLPWYVIFSIFAGRQPNLIFIVPFFSFVMLLTASVLIVRKSATTALRRDLATVAILVLIGFPFAPAQGSLLQSGVHGATLTLALFGIWLAQCLLSERPGHPMLLLPFSLIVFMTVSSDPQVDAYFFFPILLFAVIRLWLFPQFRRYEWALAGCALISGSLGLGFIDYITTHGGFQLQKNYSLGFVDSAAGLAGNLHALLRAVQILFDARASELARLHLHHLIAWSRLITLLVIVALCLRVIWQAPRAPRRGVVQLLVLGAACLFALDSMSGMFAAILFGDPDKPVYVIRYVTPAYVLLSLAGVIEAQELRIKAPQLRKAAMFTGIVFAFLFILGAMQVVVRAARAPSSIAAAPQLPLTEWLEARGLRYGLGDYWTTQMVTALSRGQVIAEPVIAPEGKLIPLLWVGDMADAVAGRRPQFVAFLPGNRYGVTVSQITAAYGQPRNVVQVGPYTVAVMP